MLEPARIDGAGRERCLQGAARFGLVLAVAEAAFAEVVLELDEARGEFVGREVGEAEGL